MITNYFFLTNRTFANLYTSDYNLPVNCGSENTVRAFRRRQCFKALSDNSFAVAPKSG